MGRSASVAAVLVVLLSVAAFLWIAGQNGRATDGAPSATRPARATRTTTHSGKRLRARVDRTSADLGTGEVFGTLREQGTRLPVADQVVMLTADESFADRTLATRTRPDGSFRFAGVPGGDGWTLRVDARDPLADLEHADVSVADGEATDLGVLLLLPAPHGRDGTAGRAAGLRIAGTLATDDGATPDSGWISASAVPASRASSDDAAYAWAGIDAGRFEVGPLPAGTYEVTAHVPGRRPASVRATAGDAAVRIVVDAGARITGCVLREDGTACAGAWVHASSDGGGGGGSAMTDAEGRYTVTGLDGGTFRLTATAAGGEQPGTGAADDVGVAPGSAVVAPTISIRARPRPESLR